MSPSTTGPGPIGLDIGARTIRAAQLWFDAGRPRLHAAVCASRAEPERPLSPAEAERLARILERQGFDGLRTVLALPDEKLLSNTFEHASQAAGAPLEVVSRVELARSVGCAPPQIEAACWALPAPARARHTTHVLAVGCLQREADEFLDAVECAALRVDALEPRPVAIARSCIPLVGPRSGISAIVEVGWEGVTTAILYQDALVYHRSNAELGLGVAARAIASSLNAEEELAEHMVLGRSSIAGPEEGGPRLGLRADAAQLIGEHVQHLAHELNLSLSYASHWYAQPRVDAVLMSGEGAAMPGLLGAISAAAGVEARVATPVDLLGGDAARWCRTKSRGTELMTALGLAMRTQEDPRGTR